MAAADTDTRLIQLEKALCERIAKLEEQVAQLTRQANVPPAATETAWWKKIVGVYKNDPEFEGAMRLGRGCRDSLRPGDADETETI